MNKPVAIAASIAGAICAYWLVFGDMSYGSGWFISSCHITDSQTVSRDLTWQGSDAINVHVPATVHFTAAPQWRAIAQGSEELVKHVRLHDGRIEWDRSGISLCDGELTIELSGPAVTEWTASGSGDVLLEQLNQPQLQTKLSGSGKLTAYGTVTHVDAQLSGSGDMAFDFSKLQKMEIDVHGSGAVTARGSADTLNVAIFGSGNAQLGKLTTQQAKVAIFGSGNVTIAPVTNANVEMYGSGTVRMVTKPDKLQSTIHGSGNVIGAG